MNKILLSQSEIITKGSMHEASCCFTFVTHIKQSSSSHPLTKFFFSAKKNSTEYIFKWNYSLILRCLCYFLLILCFFFFHIFSADNLFVSLRLFSSEQKLLYGMYLNLILSVYVLQGKVKYYFFLI